MKLSYTLLAPFYDLIAGPAFTAARQANLAALPRLRVIDDQPAAAAGWFRLIRLEKT